MRKLPYNVIFDVTDSWEHVKRSDHFVLMFDDMLIHSFLQACPEAHVLFGLPLYASPALPLAPLPPPTGSFSVHPPGDYPKRVAFVLISAIDQALQVLGPDSEKDESCLRDLGARLGQSRRMWSHWWPHFAYSLWHVVIQSLNLLPSDYTHHYLEEMKVSWYQALDTLVASLKRGAAQREPNHVREENRNAAPSQPKAANAREPVPRSDNRGSRRPHLNSLLVTSGGHYYRRRRPS